MFSIIIPTLNNLEYLKICIESINKNSKYKHEIIPHINIGNDGTVDYLKKNKIKFICLAGFMKILTSSFIKKFNHKIIIKKKVRISTKDNSKYLAKKILKKEHELYQE